MSDGYLLGYTDAEWRRLEAQHALWGPILMPVLRGAGLGPGARVLDAGCGVGVLLRDLAETVGATGRVVGVEVDPRSAEAAARRVPTAEVRTGDLRTADLGEGYDLAVSRWVLSFLPEPAPVVARLADALAPGGHLVVQDYHHDGLSLFPDRGGAFATVITALRRAFARTGGDLWIAGRLPAYQVAAGLEVVDVRPQALAGGPDSGVWKWVTRFLVQHTPGLVARGDLSHEQHDAFREALRHAAETPGATLFSPQVVSVVGRRA